MDGSNAAAIHTEKVGFAADGVDLVGMLRVPAADGPVPAVALTGPFTGVKDQVTGAYADQCRGVSACRSRQAGGKGVSLPWGAESVDALVVCDGDRPGERVGKWAADRRWAHRVARWPTSRRVPARLSRWATGPLVGRSDPSRSSLPPGVPLPAQSPTTITLPRAVTVAAGVFAPGHLGELTRYLPFELGAYSQV
jgi:hypothetical protein